MVDTRSAGSLGIPGGLNFKSGDISGTAAKAQDDRADRGMDYFRQDEDSENESKKFKSNNFVDKSAQLNATLNSLALINVASILNSKKPVLNKKNIFKF